MATKKNPTRPRRIPVTRMAQNFHLVWLDGSIDEENDDGYHNSIAKLRQVVNTVNTFTDMDECIDFMTDVDEINGFMIVSKDFIQTLMPIVQEISQINSVYVLHRNEEQQEECTESWSKMKGVFTDITSICEALKQATSDCDYNAVSISFIKATDGSSNQNLDTLDQSFMYTQILKEILLTIDFEQVHANKFLTYARQELAGNTKELKNVDKIEKEYRLHQPVWWYTYQSFLYSMVNRALRTMEIDLIVTIGFFIRDLHNHIVKLHAEQFGGHKHSNTFIVYRGQGLSQAHFEQIKKTSGGLLSFNSFLSTSENRDVSLRFARRIVSTSDLNASCYQKEEEILFSMHSIFRIGQVKSLDENSRLWEVELTLTSDSDPQLHTLTERIQKEISGKTGWHRLGQLMIKLGQFNEAEELCNILLQQTNDDREKEYLYYMLGIVKNSQGKYSQALEFCEKSVKINQKIFSPTSHELASSYTNISYVYYSMGEYSKAFSYYERAHEIYQKIFPANHPSFAASYTNIALVYSQLGKYLKALSYHERAHEIYQKILPANHPLLAQSYHDIGTVYIHIGEYAKALSYYEKALEIQKKTLSKNHPWFAQSYHNIGTVYIHIGEYSKALSYYEKALEIQKKTLSENHPSLAQSYHNIGTVYIHIGEYSKSLLYLEKALKIQKKTLSANDPDLAVSYSNIGGMYYYMGEHSKGLSYFERAFDIFKHSLPPETS